MTKSITPLLVGLGLLLGGCKGGSSDSLMSKEEQTQFAGSNGPISKEGQAIIERKRKEWEAKNGAVPAAAQKVPGVTPTSN